MTSRPVAVALLEFRILDHDGHSSGKKFIHCDRKSKWTEQLL
jgi:hypothetical protein